MSKFKDARDSINKLKKKDWNTETKFYVIGEIDEVYASGRISRSEWEELYKIVPVKQEELEKVNY